MASHVGALPRATPPSSLLPPQTCKHSSVSTTRIANHSKCRSQSSKIRVSNGGDSYLDMWKKAVDRDRKAIEFQKIAENSAGNGNFEDDVGGGENPEALQKKSNEFQKILQVSPEERDRVQRMQVIDRAAAAIAAARAILKESSLPPSSKNSGDSGAEISRPENGGVVEDQLIGAQNENLVVSHSDGAVNGTPGPNFWSWIPPPEDDRKFEGQSNPKLGRQAYPYPIMNTVIEKEQSVDFLSIPHESKLYKSNNYPSLPPLQSLMEVEKVDVSISSQETAHIEEKRELGVQFSAHAEEAALALNKVDRASSQGVNPDGSRWWKETGTEQRPDGVVCRWTLIRGVSAEKDLEWEEKYWEAADQYDYKELGSEKSGRDAFGSVWREFWKESMWQDSGLIHLEKTADKWGNNGKGDEWQEKWWEHYDASGQSEKWAHKWCSIDPSTQLEAGHAHVWHERWGEKYDGKGSSIKYTDKWADRCEGDGWTKWGDKWDENFDSNGHGVKQGETWWEGKYGEHWNRTWGEGHNGSGWVHKYGKSSCGEHWDTHVEQETWYERYPHFGFQHCLDNSVQLREVRKPSE